VLDKQSKINSILQGIDYQDGLERCMNDQSFLFEIILDFCNIYSGSVSVIEKDLENCDYKNALSLIHSIKGSSGSIGALRLHELCVQFEVELKEDQFKYVPQSDLFHQFKDEMNLVLSNRKVLQ